MHAIKGKYRNGQIVLAEKADWPENIDVVVEPVSPEKTLGIRDEDWPTDPEGLAKLLALMDSIEPFEMTPAEEAEWRAARQERREYDLAHFNDHAERLRRMFE